MDKSKIKFYHSNKEIEENAEQILKDWKRHDDDEHIFTAMHQQTGLHLLLNEETGVIEASNWADWSRHMSLDEKLTASEILIYQQRLMQEFGFWVKKEDERLIKEFEKAQKEGEQAANAINAFADYAFANMKNKAKN